MFGFFKKKPKRPEPDGPLAAFDAVLESVERQGHEVRKSAATLLAVLSQLKGDEQRYQAQLKALESRVAEAAEAGEAQVETVLRNDVLDVTTRLEATRKAMAAAEQDAALLRQAAEEQGRRLAELKVERVSAQARLSAGLVISEALQQQVEQIDRVLKLDRARDEIEKAHALADIYREEASQKKPR